VALPRSAPINGAGLGAHRLEGHVLHSPLAVAHMITIYDWSTRAFLGVSPHLVGVDVEASRDL
jgi:hypothetical protein